MSPYYEPPSYVSEAQKAFIAKYGFEDFDSFMFGIRLANTNAFDLKKAIEQYLLEYPKRELFVLKCLKHAYRIKRKNFDDFERTSRKLLYLLCGRLESKGESIDLASISSI